STGSTRPRQQRHAIRNVRRHPRGPERRINLFNDARRTEYRFVTRFRRRSYKRKAEIASPRGRAKIRNRFVEERHDLPDVTLAVTVVGGRPVGERLTRVL